MKKINIGITGGAGYTGGGLIRVLLGHPYAKIAFVQSRSNAGKYIHQVHPDLLGETDIQFTAAPSKNWGGAEVLFLCVGHGEAKKFLEENKIPKHLRVIDLSQDFRISSNS